MPTANFQIFKQTNLQIKKMEEVFRKFKVKFIDEAFVLLNDIEKGLLNLENNPLDTDIIPEIFRVMHTLKGVSSMYGFDHIAVLTHKLESIYEYIRDQNVKLSSFMVDTTLKAIDHIKNLLDDDTLSKQTNKEAHTELLEDITLISKSFSQPITEPPKTVDISKFQLKNSNNRSYYIMLLPNESFIEKGINIVDIFRQLSKLGEFQIIKHQFAGFPGHETTPENAWGVYLSTKVEIVEIQNIFTLIADNVKIIKVSNQNIFNQEEILDNGKKDENEFFEDLLNDDDGSFGFFSNDDEEKEQIEEGLSQKQNDNQNTENQAIDLEINENIEIAKTLIEVKKHHAPNINIQNQISTRISVDSAKLDQLMYLVSELITTNAQLTMANRTKDMLILDKVTEKVEKLSKLFRENAINLRLVPVDDVVIRFQRLIRDLSHSLGKDIQFVTQGADTELDKSIIDQLVEPLMHLIRNCIDHGIEAPELRLISGKSKTGTIKFSAFYSGTYVYIKIEDDGKGIDTEKILKKAIEKGFVSPDAKLTKKEILSLIFLPGFSTAESLTQVSGRGVGMDVVRRKISDLHGDVNVESELGHGTSFTIKLQQTISIIDGLLIKADETYFMLPLSEVEICDERKHSEIFQNLNQLIDFDNDLVPFIHLRSQFALDSQCPKIEKIVIVNKNDHRIAIIADAIIGEQQSVIKPMGKIFKNQDFILGASIMGDGNLALMLDTQKLADLIYKK